MITGLQFLKDPEIADHADYRSEYNVGVGTAEQNKSFELGVATKSLHTALPITTQSVAIGENVADIASIVELYGGLGRAEQNKSFE